MKITRKEFENKLDELAKSNWKFNNLYDVANRKFENLNERIQQLACDEIGVKKITKTSTCYEVMI